MRGEIGAVRGEIGAVRGAARQEERATTVMHLFAGRRRAADVEEFAKALAAKRGVRLLFLAADLESDDCWDLSLPHTFALLHELAQEGLIDLLIGGPPCSTWSKARHRAAPGPRPVRDRYEARWGLQDLWPWERERELRRRTS